MRSLPASPLTNDLDDLFGGISQRQPLQIIAFTVARQVQEQAMIITQVIQVGLPHPSPDRIAMQENESRGISVAMFGYVHVVPPDLSTIEPYWTNLV